MGLATDKKNTHNIKLTADSLIYIYIIRFVVTE